MPGILLKISGRADPALTRRIVPQIMDLTCNLLDKEPERTMVMVEYIPHDAWFIAGQSLAELGRNSFRLEVTIVDETCTKRQKAAFHKAAFAALSELIGNVHPHSNIHVVDCRGTAYGYGGLTQEYRHQHPADAQGHAG
jgi:4-oxalocrotonate tautomerase